MTPFGNVDLDSLFGSVNVADPLDAGDAFAGLADAGSAAATEGAASAASVIDPLAFLGR